MLPTKEEILPPSCMDLVNPSVYEPNHDTDTDFIKHFKHFFSFYWIYNQMLILAQRKGQEGISRDR